MSIEEENELKQFLMVCRPDWSLPKRKGHCDIVRACEKLKAIGVENVTDMLNRITANTINDDFSAAKVPRFSRETLASIRKEGAFWHSLEHLSEPSFRQIGLFAPVPQMLAGRNLRTEALKSFSGSNSGSLQPVTGGTPARQSRLQSAGSCRTAVSTASNPTRPATVDITSIAGSSAAFSDEGSPRIRPTSMALAIPCSSASNWDEGSDIGEADFGTLPRLRNARIRPGRDITHLEWKRNPGRTSSSPAPRPSSSDGQGVTLLPPSLESTRGSLAKSDLDLRRRQFGSGRTAGSLSASKLSQASQAAGSLTASKLSQATAGSLSAAIEQVDQEQAERYTTIGRCMSTGSLEPGWSTTSGLLEHGEAMIKEQEEHRAKKTIYQQIALEGKTSPMRNHLAGKIGVWLKDEKLRDAQAVAEVQQSCINIKKQITGMSTARKNLNTLRMETQHSLNPLAKSKPEGLSMGGLFSKKAPVSLGDDEED